MEKLEIKYIPINDIKPYKNNPRLNEEAIPFVMNSIKEFGFKNPIILDKNNVIVAGHTRLESAKRLDMKEIPVIYADDLTEEQVKAFRLADNKVSEKSMWDYSKLDEELDSILDIDMSMFDFDIVEDSFDTEFELPDGDTPQTRTITLSLAEEQYQICMKCIEFIQDNNLIIHDFDNANKKSNALFEVIYQWAEQKTLL